MGDSFPSLRRQSGHRDANERTHCNSGSSPAPRATFAATERITPTDRAVIGAIPHDRRGLSLSSGRVLRGDGDPGADRRALAAGGDGEAATERGETVGEVGEVGTIAGSPSR